MDTTPKVSIGLAVFNGEKYLEEAVDSILAQTFTDFELIISDNASTDLTDKICRRYAELDSRIRYYRNPTNIGGANNENQTFKLARGEYFRWAAHDDVCAPELLERCVEILDRDDTVVLAHSKIIKIDQDGSNIGLLDQDKARSSNASDRFRDLTGWDHDCEATYGLIRSDVMRMTDLQLNYTDSDRTLLCEISLYGRFFQISEPLFYKRYHPEMSTEIYQDWRERMDWFDPGNNGRTEFTYWKQFTHYMKIISRAPIPFNERMRCYAHMGTWVFTEKRWGRMANDVLIASSEYLNVRRRVPAAN